MNYLTIEQQIRYAISKNFYVRDGLDWYRVLRFDDDTVTLLRSECDQEDSECAIYHTVDLKRWRELVEEDGTGLHRIVNARISVPAFEPWDDDVLLAHRNPKHAGKTIYELRQENARLKAELAGAQEQAP